MDENSFLEGYDPADYPRFAVTVDLVLMTVRDAAPAALLVRRGERPFEHQWALPGGFVRPDEDLEAAARRLLGAKAHLEGCWLEQLYSFGAVDRDPRMRVITVAYFALLPAGRLEAALAGADDLALAQLADLDADAGVTGLRACGGSGEALPLAFDHADILAVALSRLRGKLDYSGVAFALLPELFTLRELQQVHEAILGRRLNKPAFRRRMRDKGWLEATGARETGASYRPAELFRYRPSGLD